MVSVVIPAFNAGRFISRTIDSVLAQTYGDYEIIVVDDGSVDNTAEVVKSYGPKVRYIYQENAGDGPARNTGISAARGEWIAFLDHDDEWLPQKLQSQMELLGRNPDLSWCAANYYEKYGVRQRPAGDYTALSRVLGGKDYFDNLFTAVHKKGCSLITATMMVRRDVFEKAGLFDSCWRRCADYDMWWRIAYHYPRIGYLAQPLAVMHLDVQVGTTKQLALEDKRAADVIRLIGRHLELAGRYGAVNEFRPLASDVLRKGLKTALFHGFGQDARDIIKQFADLFGWYVRCAVILLTVFPHLTSAVMRTTSYLRRLLRLGGQVTRPYSHAEIIKTAQGFTKGDCSPPEGGS